MRKLAVITLLLTSFAVFAQDPNVEVAVIAPAALSPSNQGTWIVRVTNPGTTPSGDLRLTFNHFSRYPMSGQVTFPPPCGADEYGWVSCVVNVAPGAAVELPIVVQYDRSYGHATLYTYLGDLTASASILFPREYLVTTVADSGPGSLRQVILDINRDCATTAEPCGAVFRISGPVPDEGWFTIRPLSPLPEVTVPFAVIDASTQSQHTGQTNGGGPEIMLDGSSAGPAHGLRFSSSWGAHVSHLAIGNFDGNGIESNDSLSARFLYVGLHPSGLLGAPNAGRGIQVNSGNASIGDSYLCANGRAGAYLTGGAVNVQRSFVGVGVDGVTPLGNGASGLFFQKYGPSWEEHGASDNVIANNGHAGIAFTTNVIGNFGRNTFHNNGGRAIDAEMDGATLEPREGVPGHGGILGAPLIHFIHYEDGVTTITGGARNPSLFRDGNIVYIYANTTGKDGGELIGITRPNPENKLFTLRVNRDLRGQYVSASEYARLVYLWDDPAPGTSEVSEPRLVQ